MAAKKAEPKAAILIASDKSQIPEGKYGQVTTVWEPNPGPQTELLKRAEFEIFYGGAKGGGKSYGGIGWLISGNSSAGIETGHPCDQSYILHPFYRAQVLRKNQIDLDDWIEKAKRVYIPLGAKFTEHPCEFVWPHPTKRGEDGAKIVVGHLADESAFEKYTGVGVVRFFIDELTFIPSFKLYMKVLSCCRSSWKELRPQVLSTGNPGGPGTAWVKRRFIDVIAPKTGQRVPPMTTMGEKFYNPLLKRDVFITRVFIPSGVTDNPKLVDEDPLYVTRLMMLPEAERRAYLDGDWDALSGQYFADFRPHGPLTAERELFPWANHVIKAGSVALAPWWHRWMSMDWGHAHNTAVYWSCQHPNGQVHVYREMVRNKTTIAEIGAEIARQTIDDLRGLEQSGTTPQMTLWLSHELFDKTGEDKTRAEQLGWAIGTVLGPEAVAVLSIEQERSLDGNPAQFWTDRSFQRKAVIVVRRAKTDRISGWQYMRECLRFRPTTKPIQSAFDYNYALKLASEDGATKYFEYIKQFKVEQETLPILQIWDCCGHLIRAIPDAIYDEGKPEDVTKQHFDGLDSLDSCRYILMAHKFTKDREPKDVYVANQLNRFEPSGLDWTQRVQIAEKATRDWESTPSGKPFFLPRASSRRAHWMVN